MGIIDFHAHIYPADIASKAVKNVGKFYGIEMNGNGTLEQLIKDGNAKGVTDFVIHSPALVPENVASINDYMLEQSKLFKGVHGYGTLHAAMESPDIEIDRMISLGLKGVKIHPDSQRFNIDDKRMMPMYKILEEKSFPILFHCGDYRYDYSHPRRLASILDAFPKLTVIAAHFGGWSVPDLALEYLQDRQCYLDLSSSLEYIGTKRANELIRLYGADRILFGSDFPMRKPSEVLEIFYNIDLTQSEQEKILFKNAQEILKI